MTDLGRCARCGRPRTTTPSGAPVSCCPRHVAAPRTAGEAQSMIAAVAAFLDRVILRAPRATAGSGCGVGCLLAAIFAVFAVVLAMVSLGR